MIMDKIFNFNFKKKENKETKSQEEYYDSDDERGKNLSSYLSSCLYKDQAEGD